VSPVRVVLADDHTLVRAGIRSLLESIDGVEVVGESGDGRETLELIAKHRPDVALLDIAMPGHADTTYLNQALRAGVSGYLLKGAAVAELPLALQAVMRGETYLTPKISQRVVEGFLSGDGEPADDPLESLTARQREILQLIAEGRSTKEIAGMLDVSVKTVETHRTRLMERLDIRDVPGLVRFAIRAGLVLPGD